MIMNKVERLKEGDKGGKCVGLKVNLAKMTKNGTRSSAII